MIFLDTSFFVAYEVETDSNHEKAVVLRKRILDGEFGQLVVSDYILDEVLTVTFRKIKDLQKAVSIGTEIRNSSILIKLEMHDFNDTWKTFGSQKGKLSFTDCSNLVIMKRMGIKNIATFDEGFDKIKEVNVIS